MPLFLPISVISTMPPISIFLHNGGMRPALKLPPDHDLRQLLRFSTDEGSIWLGSRRMVLVHAESLGRLRKALLSRLGLEEARSMMLSAGFSSGLRDAEFIRQLRGDQPPDVLFMIGPQLHMIEGAAEVRPVRQEFDYDSGHFIGEFTWRHSWEAYAHRQMVGPSDIPVCWTLLGYASGFTSAFMQRLVLFEEISCAASGHTHCHILGKSIHMWADTGAVHQLYDVDHFEALLQASGHRTPQLLASHLHQPFEQPSTPPDTSAAPAGETRGDFGLVPQQWTMLERGMQAGVPLLLQGEFGTGKQTLARRLHAAAMGEQPFVMLDCQGLSADELDIQLFGEESRSDVLDSLHAATHALAGTVSRGGRLEQAGEGALYLHNIEHVPLLLQDKLLDFLRHGSFLRHKGNTPVSAACQLIVASGAFLEQLAQQGQFRRELLLRLQTVSVTLPPLRERLHQIPILAEAMLAHYAARYKSLPPTLSEHALQTLMHQSWPGNLSELGRLLERAVLLAGNQGTIDTRHLFPLVPEQPHTALTRHGSLTHENVRRLPGELCASLLSSGVTLPDIESQLLEFAVQQSRGNLAAAARQLGLTRPQLAYRLQRSTQKSF